MNPTTSQLLGIPSGKAGTLATLRIMRGLVRKYKAALPVRLLAQKIVQHNAPKNYTGEVETIFKFVRDKIRYLKDVNGIETIQTPIKTLEFKSGDCDDKSSLLAAMLESIGHTTRFIAVGFIPLGGYSHVLVQTRIGNNWVYLDATEPYKMGWSPPKIIKRLIVRN